MIGAAVQVAAGVAVAVWAVRAANSHTASTPMLERMAVALMGAAGVLAAWAAVVRA